MNTNVETKVNEATNEELKETRILARDTKGSNNHSRETIYLSASGKVGYHKFYIPKGSDTPRRHKDVELPVSIDGKKFSTCKQLFDYLLASGAYRQVSKVGA